MRPLTLVFALIVATSAIAQDIQHSVAHSWIWFERNNQALRIPCLKSHPLDQQHPEITRVVVSIHGTLRNANEYHPSLVDALALAGDQADSTLLITPQLLTDADTEYHHLSDVLCWSYYGWRQGDRSVNGYGGARPWNLSSFALVDSLFLRAAAACPNLRDAVLVGHSAGGQATNRWSASSTVPDRLRNEHGVHFRGVVLNPSSYVYFSPERREVGTVNVFSLPTPGQIAACPDYDDYKYGLQDPNPWFAQHADSLRTRYSRRHVVHLVGELDCDPDDDYLDRTCMADIQGSQRLDRCRTYWNYLNWYFGGDLDPRQTMAVVPGVGHDFHGMFTSPCGVFHLFDVGQCGEGPNAVDVPALAGLGAPYPNPFNPLIILPLAMGRSGRATVEIYDLRGRLVRRLLDADLAAGAHHVRWAGADDAGRQVVSGVYLARAAYPEGEATARLVLVR